MCVCINNKKYVLKSIYIYIYIFINKKKLNETKFEFLGVLQSIVE